MKKFMKICGITAAILILAGLLIAVPAGLGIGRGVVSEVVEEVTDGKVQLNLGHLANWGITVIGHGNSESHDSATDGHNNSYSFGHSSETHDTHDSHSAGFDIDEKSIFRPNQVTYKGTMDKTDFGSDVASIDIKVGGCKLVLIPSGDNRFYAEASNINKLQAFVEDEILHIYSVKTGTVNINLLSFGKADAALIKVYVPENFVFEQAKVSLGAGLIEAQELYAYDLNIEVGAGAVEIEHIAGERLNAEVGMGEIQLLDMNVDDLNAEVGLGSLQMKGDVRDKAELEVAMGSIDMQLNCRESDYNYKLESAAGSITLGGDSYSGLSHEKHIDNGSDVEICAEAAMGSIDITFRGETPNVTGTLR